MISKTNFKKILASVGILTVAVPATVNVVGCGVKTVVENKDQKIVEAIKNTEFLLNVPKGTKAKSIIKIVSDVEFIKSELNDPEIMNDFDDTTLKIEAVFVNDKDLKDEDLLQDNDVNAEILFSYAEIKDKAKLIINPNWTGAWLENVRLALIKKYNAAETNEEKIKAFDKYADFNLFYITSFYDAYPFDAKKDDWHKVPNAFTEKIKQDIEHDVENYGLERNWTRFEFKLGVAALNTDTKIVTFDGSLILYKSDNKVWFAKEENAIGVQCLI